MDHLKTKSILKEKIKKFSARGGSAFGGKNKNILTLINFILLFVLLASLVTNQIFIFKINQNLGISSSLLKKITRLPFKNQEGQTKLSGDLAQDVIKLVISQGIPPVYGAELNVPFDQVQESMNIMKQFDPTYGKQKISLTSDDLKRYTEVGLKISCEYCCGAKAIINEKGMGACGCAHSQAMRGLLAYLIKNHPTEYTNDEMLRELARWKGLYFPKQMIQKTTEQLQGAKEFTPDIAALILGIELPDYGKNGAQAPLPSEIKNLPNMVGGC